MRDFELLRPESAAEASQMLHRHGEESRLLAGGTALLLALRQRLLSPPYVVYLGGVRGLDKISFVEGEGLRIGALTRIADVADHPLVRKHCPMLASMAGQVANPQVRSMATLGGNLCYGDPASDPPTCLIALGASVQVTGTGGDRVIALEDFFTDYYETALAPADIVTEIRVPAFANDASGLYSRFVKTRAEHRPLVGVAIVVRHEGAACRWRRRAVGASTPIPGRLPRAETFLRGKEVSAAVLEEMADIAADEARPVSDFRGTEEFRRDMIRVVVRRLAADVFGIETH